MSKPINDEPITRISSLQISGSLGGSNGFYPPVLTQAEINNIPFDEIQPGGIVYNLSVGSLQTYTINGWENVAVSGGGSDIFDNITVNDTATINTLDVSGTTTTNTLDVSGTTTTNTLDVTGTTTTNTLDVIGTTTTNTLAVSGNTTTNTLDVIGTINANMLDATQVYTGTIDTARVVAVGPSPAITITISTNALIVGIGASATITGDEFAGFITINTGSGTISLTGIIATVTLQTPMPNFPIGIVGYPLVQFVTETPNSLSLTNAGLGGTALSPNVSYTIPYIISGY